MGRVQDKVCIVTGAAQGIGRAIAHDLAKEGASVVIADLNEEKSQAVAKEIADKGYPSLAVKVDVTDRASVQNLIQQTVEKFGKLDVMFNNAGVNKPMGIFDYTRENWDMIMTVNGWGVLLCMQEAARQMVEQGHGGKIINTASAVARTGFPGIAPYCASKASVIIMTQSAARELAEHDIRVNSFSPGVVETPLWEMLDKMEMDAGNTEKPGEAIKGAASNTIVGRPSTPQDIVGTTTFLASDESDMMTGQNVSIDGGWVLV